MKVVCWNLNSRVSNQEAWDAIFGLNADLVLLSEVNHIPDDLRDYQYTFETATGRNRKPRMFSTGMLVRGYIGESIPLRSNISWINEAFKSFPGNFVTRHVEIEARNYNVVSCHMPSWHFPYREFTDDDVSDIMVPNYSKIYMSDLLRSALTNMLRENNENWIVGGDFNTSEFIGRSERQHEANRATIKGMEHLGLTEVVRSHNGKPVPSYRHSSGNFIHQLDHLYLSNTLAACLRTADVGEPDQYFVFSDHLPLIAVFEVNSGPA